MLPFLLNLDHYFFCLVNSHYNSFWDAFFWVVSFLGSGWVVAPILIAVAYLKLPKRKFWIFFICGASGMIISSTVNTQIKDAVQRERPIGFFVTHGVNCPGSQKGTYVVHVVGSPLACRSFPSGHANTAFCAASLLALQFGGWYWLAFVPAFLVAYSRVYMGVHFPLDAAVGAIIAVVIIALTIAAYRFAIRKQETQ